MKKRLSLLLAAAMAATMLAGCSSNEPTSTVDESTSPAP